MRTILVLVLALSAAAAGCVTTPSLTTTSTLDADALLALVAEHDHLDPLAHTAASGLTELPYVAIRDEPSTYGELDIVGDLAVIAVLEPIGGFVTIDISDPTMPAPLGWYEAGTAYAADVKLTPDGAHAFLAVNSLYAEEEITKDPLLAPTAGRAAGVHVVSVEDPAAPMLESFYPLPTGGVHMLDVHVIGGETYVFSIWSAGGLPIPNVLPLPTPRASYVDIAKLGEGPNGMHSLTHVSRYALPEQEGQLRMTGQHDVTVVDDPELGALLLCACGFAGVGVADINDPAMPQHLGSWTDHDDLYVHTVMMTHVEGKRVLVAIPETFAADRQQPLWVIDADDLSALATMGTWQLPGADLPYDAGYRFSTHNFNIHENRIYLAHFHAGVWVLDISTLAKAAAPEIVAYSMAAPPGLELGPSLGIAAAPLVWDAIPAKGHVFLADIGTGLRVLAPDFAIGEGTPYGMRGADGEAHHGGLLGLAGL